MDLSAASRAAAPKGKKWTVVWRNLVVATLFGVTPLGGQSPRAPDELARLAAVEVELQRQERQASVRRGAKIFARSCAACHGVEGRGNGPGAADLDPTPRDLTTRRFRFRSTASGEDPLPEDLERTIRRGLPGSSMPAFGKLFSSDEIADLIRFLESLRAADSRTIPQALPLAPLAEAGADELGDGQALYLLVGCWRCHGLDGSGRGPSTPLLTDSEGRPTRPTDFRRDPFKGGREPLDVVRVLRTGLNGTPMPSYDEAMMIAREDVGDLPALEGLITDQAEENVARFLRTSPTRDSLDSMSAQQQAELRDRRLATLARYVLSFDRRKGSWFWTFQQQPEKEPRKQ